MKYQDNLKQTNFLKQCKQTLLNQFEFVLYLNQININFNNMRQSLSQKIFINYALFDQKQQTTTCNEEVNQKYKFNIIKIQTNNKQKQEDINHKNKKNNKQKDKNKNKNQIQEEKQEETQKPSRNNLLSQLTQIFQVSRNDAKIIHPWMNNFKQIAQRIIGTNYIVIGPCQSGKYSVVKYALQEHHKGVHQIVINCDISTTQYQFFRALLNKFRQKFPDADWPQQQKQINKIIVNQNIQFSRLNEYIIALKEKFCIIVRNGEHLIGFKKQSILYNLFQWMNEQEVKKRAGLVILSRYLLFTDRLQKRIRSRFCGNRLFIFRPEDPEIYINIITKRIDYLLDNTIYAKDRQLRKGIQQMIDEKEDVFQFKQQSQQQVKKTNRQKAQQKKGNNGNNSKQTKNPYSAQQVDKIIQKYKGQEYMQDLLSYYNTLRQYIPNQILINDIKIVKFFWLKVKEFQRIQTQKSPKKLKFFNQQTQLSLAQQVDVLENLREAIKDNNQIKFFFKDKILENQIITIPFILRIFQHFFMTIDQSLLRYLSVKSLKKLILIFLQKNIEFQFPMNLIQCHSLQNFNNVQLLLLILIYKFVEDGQYPIRLCNIYKKYKSQICQSLRLKGHGEQISSKYPMLQVERAMQRLYRSQAISYEPTNLWNSFIELTFQRSKIKKGLQNLSKTNQLPQIHKQLFRQLGIGSKQSSKKIIY